MMIIPATFCAVFIRYTNADGHRCENVMGYFLSGSLLQANVDDISSHFAPSYKAQLDTGSTYDGVHVLEGNGSGPPNVFDSNAGSGAGTAGGAKCPPNVQGLISKRTGLSGRKFRGRVFIADMAVAQVNSQGGLASTAIAKLDAINGDLFDVSSDVPVVGAPHILHSDSTAPTEITSMQTEATVATQRRRLER